MEAERFVLRRRSRETRQASNPNAPARASDETLACPCCELKLPNCDDALCDHVRTNHTAVTQVSGVAAGTTLFLEFLRDEARHTGKVLRGRNLPEIAANKASSYRTSPYRVQQESRLKTYAHRPRIPSSTPSRDRIVTAIPEDSVVLPARVDGRWTGLVLQPISRLISEEQLYTEVDSIYTGLTRIESKCIHFYSTQVAFERHTSCGQRMMLAPAQWLALAGLHRALLCEHHDFFLASHHPSASTALRDRAMEYSMPARMWNHGIYSFLDLLRQYLPESLEHLLAFTSLAYQMITSLYEAIPAFECTWVKYLGEIARYRMEIAGEDQQEQEIWATIAHFWHLKAADRVPCDSHPSCH